MTGLLVSTFRQDWPLLTKQSGDVERLIKATGDAETVRQALDAIAAARAEVEAALEDGNILALRLLQSDLVLDDTEIAARDGCIARFNAAWAARCTCTATSKDDAIKAGVPRYRVFPESTTT